MPPLAAGFSLFMAVPVMGLAVWALPYPGNLVLLGCAAAGAAIAVWRIRRAQDESAK